jgi:2'-5' RNA ligase
MRLFAALVPPADAILHLRLALGSWTAGDGGRPLLRWTDPERWHITLAFYGDVPEGALPELESALAEGVAPVEPPDLRLRGAGSYSGRTLWVGVAGEEPGDTDGLGRLLGVAATAGERLGAVPDRRERRRAHLTLARARPGPRETASSVLTAAVRALSVYEGPLWRAESIALVSSRLGAGRGGGPLHETVAEFPLGLSTGFDRAP